MGTYTAQQITKFVQEGRGPESLHNGGRTSLDMSGKHQDVVDEMKALQRDMAPHWEGNAADRAYAGANPLIAASEVSGGHLSKAQQLYDGQGESFDRLKGDVGEGVGAPPESTWMSDSPLQFLTGRDEEIEAYNAEAQRIADAYDRYRGDSGSNAAQWPEDYGELGMPPGGADFAVDMPSAGSGGAGSTQPPSSGGGYSATAAAGGYGGGSAGAGSYSGAPTGVGGYSSGPGTSGAYPGGAPAPAPGGGQWYPQTPAASGGGTGTAAYTDPSSVPGYGGPYGTGAGYPTASGAGGTQGGGYAYGPGGGTRSGYSSSGGSGFGPRGSASYGSTFGGFGPRGSSGFGPTGSGTGASPSPGRASGVGPAPREATGPVRGASAAAGSAGSNSYGRAAPMGMGGAGRGQGGEDETHERPSYLEENDVDSIFGPDPDDKTVPPVIGL